MTYISSLSASSLLSAHIRQDVSIVFYTTKRHFSHFSLIRKSIYLFSACIAFCGFLPGSGYAAEEVGTKKEFIITAYYSPLPNQNFYLKGNYDAERILNGNGTNGASGKPVFTGMLAAPKTYTFGTKIVFEGLGAGIVEDRGGAIVTAGERGQSYDRIDIWMGQGETGLRRALIWGRRKVTGTIVDSKDGTPILDITAIDSGRIDLSRFEKVTSVSMAGMTKEVLEMFADLGYTTEGRSMRDMVLAFQLDHGVVVNSTDPGAGNYGPLTKATLAEAHGRYDTIRNAELKAIEEQKALLIAERNNWEKAYTIARSQVQSFGSPKKGQSGSNVRSLQVFLRDAGYFKGKDTGIMGNSTILALRSFQKANGLSMTGAIDTHTQDALIERVMEKWG